MPEQFEGYRSPEEEQSARSFEQEKYESNVETEREKPIDALVVFGGGSISDKNLEEAMMGKRLIGKQEQGWRLPLMAKLRIMAAAELYQNGQVDDVIMSEGTKASEGMTISGAELMKKYFKHVLENRWRHELMEQQWRGEKGEIDKDDRTEIAAELNHRWKDVEPHIFLEDKATNTIENFAYTVNFLDANREKYQNIGLLSSDFHINRIMKLADKVKIQGKGFGSEEIIKKSTLEPRLKNIADKYFNPEKNEEYRRKVLQDLSDEEKRIYEKRLGTSAKRYIREENRWSRGLDEIPEYWLQNVQFITNRERLLNMLELEGIEEILQTKGVEDIDAASADDIRQALSQVKRKMPPEEWGEQK